MRTTLFAPSQRALTMATMTSVAVAAYNNLSVSAALPAIGDDLGNLDLLPWVITIELIASAIAVLAVGPMLDSIGSRTVFRWSMLAFSMSCIACALAPDIWSLIAARGLQGLTTGVIISNVMTALGLGVPESLRPRAYAVNSSVWGVMGVGGPALAAVVLTVADWSAIFWVNLPFAAVATLFGWRAFPEAPEGASQQPLDRRGLTLLVAFTFLSLGAVSTLSLWALLGLAGAAALVAIYVRYEPTVASPILRIRHLVASNVRLLHLTAFLTITGGICANTFLPIYAKGARGVSTSEAAFTVVFLTAGWTAGAFVSSRIAENVGGVRALVASSTWLSVTTLVGALAVWGTWPLWILFAAFVGIGGGLGGVSSTGLAVLQSQAVPVEMGRVNAAHQFVRTLGFSYGAALGGAVLFGVVASRLGDADAARELLSDDVEAVGGAAADALQTGFAWSITLAAVLAAFALVGAIGLNQQHRTALAGASA